VTGEKLIDGQPINPLSDTTGLARMSQAPTQSLVIRLKVKLNMLQTHPELFSTPKTTARHSNSYAEYFFS
jgi:hypothetical protein